MNHRPHRSPLFPYTTLFRSPRWLRIAIPRHRFAGSSATMDPPISSTRIGTLLGPTRSTFGRPKKRSEEHTSELQSHSDLVCRLLLEKKKHKYKENKKEYK